MELERMVDLILVHAHEIPIILAHAHAFGMVQEKVQKECLQWNIRMQM